MDKEEKRLNSLLYDDPERRICPTCRWWGAELSGRWGTWSTTASPTDAPCRDNDHPAAGWRPDSTRTTRCPGWESEVDADKSAADQFSFAVSHAVASARRLVDP